MTKRTLFTFAGVALLVACAGTFWVRQQVTRWSEQISQTTNEATLTGPLQAAWGAARARAAQWPVDEAAVVELTELAITNALWDDAERLLPVLIERQAKEPRWLHVQAVLLSGRGELEPAIANWRQVVARAPDYLPAQIRFGDALAKMNQRVEAEKVFRGVLEKQPEHPYAVYGLVKMQVQAGEFGSALERLAVAVKTAPDFYGHHALRQAAARATGDTALAAAADAEIKRLGRYVEIPDPWFDPVREKCFDAYRASIVGSAFFAQRAWALGEQWYGRAVELNPSDASSWRWVAACATQQQRFDVAREAYRKSSELEPARWETFLWWANLEQSLQREKESLAVVEAGMQHHPQNLELLRLRILLMIKLGKVRDVSPFVKEVLRQDPDDRDLQELRAFLQTRGWMR